mgnify:CR=1 FL=1
MSQFEKLCNDYRENKRLIEELEAMNDSIKACIKGPALAESYVFETVKQSPKEPQKLLIKPFPPLVSIPPALRKYTRNYSPSTAPRQHTSVLQWFKGVKIWFYSVY